MLFRSITVVTFIVLFASNWGEVRVYVFIGLGLGAVFYAVVLSKSCYRLLEYIMSCLCLVARTMISPFVWIVKRIMVVWSFSKRVIRVFKTRIRTIIIRIKVIFPRKKKE